MAKPTILEKFLMRLQSVANNEHNGGSDGVAFIQVELFTTHDQIIGWPKPQRIPLEPKLFDCSTLPLQPVCGWPAIASDLSREIIGSQARLHKTLVVKDGEPVGWLRTD